MDRLAETVIVVSDSATKKKLLELMLNLLLRNERISDKMQTFIMSSPPVSESLRFIDVNGRAVNVLNLQMSLFYVIAGTLLVVTGACGIYKIYSNSYEIDQLNPNTLYTNTNLGLDPYDCCTDDTGLLTTVLVFGVTTLVYGLISLSSC